MKPSISTDLVTTFPSSVGLARWPRSTRRAHDAARGATLGFARAVRCLLVGCLLVGCAGAAQPPRNATRHEGSALVLLENADASAAVGDMTRAEQYLVAALEAGADDKQIVERLLQVCVADRRYPVAVRYAEQYLRRHPRDTDVEFVAATLLAALGEPDRAESLLRDVVQRDPDRPEAHYVLATLLRERGHDPGAADRHDLAYLRLDPHGLHSDAARARLGEGAQ